MIFETHAHYDDEKFDEDRAELLSSMQENGIGRIINVSANLESLENTRKLMEEAHLYGKPVMRPMFYDFPEQDVCWELKEQYMFGPSILVAPILYEDQNERDVYLPSGNKWTLLMNGEVYEGGQTLHVTAPIDEIPVFIREGGPDLVDGWKKIRENHEI